MNGYCGKCKNYIARPFEENICSRSGKVVPFLSKRDCYEERIIEQTEEKEMTQTEKSAPRMKVCKRCGRELPIESFPKNFRTKDGHLHICRDCKCKTMKTSSVEREERRKESTTPMKFTDEELVNELRSRGWDVKCSKYVEL